MINKWTEHTFGIAPDIATIRARVEKHITAVSNWTGLSREEVIDIFTPEEKALYNRVVESSYGELSD